ncbi:MAG: 2-octaprenyl-6-methoxyphenol hydroxylase [Micavibrio sp.]|nr:2-octaprenyl-6-methoxyphenol hydroxylase [Micavibrio sp.]
MAPTRKKTADIHNHPRRIATKATKPRDKDASDFDVLIVGGGLSGGTMAALLGTQGFKVACIDREIPVTQLEEEFDGRTTAISWGSQKVMQGAGVWPDLKKNTCPIRTIDILDGNSPVLLRFGAEEVGNQSFGWIIENRLIRKALFDRMQGLKNVTHVAPAQIVSLDRDDSAVRATLKDGRRFSAPLVIGADGRNSFTREWAGIGTRGWMYEQRAVICTVTHERPHNNVAVEHFRDQGPFATLPMTPDKDGRHRSSVVWTEHCADKDSALHYPKDVFDAALTARFPDNYGRVRQTGGRFSYPLGLQHAHTYIAPRVALIAEAAHGIHPIAGQGLNMGFRDVAALCECLVAARDAGTDLGDDTMLETYQRQRRFDNMAMAGATDGLNRLFSNNITPLPGLRKVGLRMVARIPVAKKFFMHQAMGAAGLLPDLIREAKSS